MRKLFRALFGSSSLPAATMQGGGVKVKISPSGPQLPKVSMKPLLRTAGVKTIYVNWPTPEDALVIGAAMHGRAAPNAEIHPANVIATLLEVLCEMPRATALRVALAHPDAVEAMLQHSFREMRGEMQLGDPRLSEPLPAILAGAMR